MALSDLIFTNNLGSISLSRVMYSIDHKYTWDGENPAKPSISISATGYMKNTEAEMNRVHGTNGLAGLLVLPHSTLENMKIRNLTYGNGIWAPWGQVKIDFDNKDETKKTETLIQFKSLTDTVPIYNPTITFSPSIIRRGDNMVHGINGWLRQQLGHDMISISISGDVLTDPCTKPDKVLSILEQKITSDDGFADWDSMKNYPRVASLSKFIPSAKDNFDLAHVMITEGRLMWHYEENVADIEIQMVAPPQKIEPQENT